MHGQTINSKVVKAINASPLNRGLDGTVWCSTPGNFPIVVDEDVILFDAEGPGVFEVHFLMQSRGQLALDRCKAALRYMFEKHGATLIFGMVPKMLRHAAMHARLLGAKYAGDRPTPYGICELYVVPKENWKGNS
jgi:hypothetical protein